MASISIDPSGLCIDLVCTTGETDVTFSVQDIYEAWKAWMLTSDNAKYPQAMSSAGGDPLGGGEQLGAAFFLFTGNGWKICPDTTESEVRIVLSGNLFSSPAGQQLFAYGKVAPSGHTHIEMRTSSLPVAVETGVSGLTPGESAIILSLQSMIENVSGNRFTAKALETAPGSSGSLTSQQAAQLAAAADFSALQYLTK